MESGTSSGGPVNPGIRTRPAPDAVRDTLSALVERFDDRFARVHRSIAVAPAYVAELKPLPTGDAVLRLIDGTELRASRTYRHTFEDRVRGD